MKELTKAEEQVMQVLWKLEKAFVKDVLEAMPDPKPAYTTVSTIIRILEQKGFVGYTAYGKSHEYYPLVEREAYSRYITKHLIKDYFAGSLSDFVSQFTKKEKLSAQELDELLDIIKDIKKKKS
ncbi:MAG TPA: BlaI/MecI/CopY family transcriptional regulator [Chitinophagales bacterium]|nr:BlaI/MecI/CopY family transcriptional regulator [Chitinophagales bacterium]